MKLFLIILNCLWVTTLAASGISEDPLDVLTKTWDLETVRSLEIRGEISFDIVPGTKPRLTIEASRALFDQLTVSQWWGATTVAVESGLRGPRERGTVTAKMELPALDELVVLDHSSGHVDWPSQPKVKVRVGEASSLTMTFSGTELAVDASWRSSITVKGKADILDLQLRHESQVDARALNLLLARMVLDENSVFEAPRGSLGSGSVRHGSRVRVASIEGWEGLDLREESVLEPRTD